jgi:endonuclease V-like protein UPF0215 family
MKGRRPMALMRPHVLGVDDGPFEKRQPAPVPIVGAMMECPDILESVSIGSFAVDGEGATAFLGEWIASQRCYPSLQAVILGGITLAGLGIVDVSALASHLSRPVLVVNRRDPGSSRLAAALESAGAPERIAIVDRTPRAVRVHDGLYLAFAGIAQAEAQAILRASLGKAMLPEPLRVAHLIARALVKGESIGRV